MKTKIITLLLVLLLVIGVVFTVCSCNFGTDDDTDGGTIDTPATDDANDDTDGGNDDEPELPPQEFMLYSNLPFEGCRNLATPGIYEYYTKVMSGSEFTISLEDKDLVFIGAYIDGEIVSEQDNFTITMPRENVYVKFEYDCYPKGMKFSYDESLDGYIVISAYDEPIYKGEINVPGYYNDGYHGVKEVKEIDEGVFEGKTDLITITGGQKLIKIGNNAFKDCTSLTSSSLINAGIKHIGEKAFYNTALEGYVGITKALEYFGYGAFGRSKIKGFYANEALEKYTVLGNTLCTGEENDYTMLCSPMTAKDNALYQIPIEISSLAPYAMSGASFETISYVSNHSLSWYGNENFTSIGQHALEYTEVRTVEMPSSITTIEAYAFYKSDLINFYMPNIYNVTHIHEYAFAYCVYLDREKYDVESKNDNYGIKESTIGHIKFFVGLKYIGDYAFYKCNSLSFGDVTLNGGGKVEIGDYAFSGSDVSGITICNIEFDKVSSLAFVDTPLNYLEIKLHYNEGLRVANVFEYFTMNKGMATLFGGKEIYRIDFTEESKEDLEKAIASANQYANFTENFIKFNVGGEDGGYYENYMAKVLTAEFYTDRCENGANIYENRYIEDYYQISESDETIAVHK